MPDSPEGKALFVFSARPISITRPESLSRFFLGAIGPFKRQETEGQSPF